MFRDDIRREIEKIKYRDPQDNFEVLEKTDNKYKVRINWERDVYEEMEIIL